MHCVCLEKLHVAWLRRPCFLFTRSLISAYSGQLLILPLPQPPPPTIHPRTSLPSASLAVALNNTDKFTQLERAPLLTFAFASSATLRKYLPQFFILNDSQGRGTGGGGAASQRAAEGRRKVAQIKIAAKAVKTKLNSRQLRSIFIVEEELVTRPGMR